MNAKPVRNLREFLALLRPRGELAVVEAPVDPRLELAEIHRRVIAAGGPALLFTNVIGSPYPVLTNMFGTAARTELAFGRRPLEFVQEAARLAHDMPPTPAKLWRARGLLAQAARIGLRRRRGGPVTETVESPPRLTRLPLLTGWPEDGGAFLTLPLVLTHSPQSGKSNLGMYRMQRYDDATMGLHWQIGKGGGFHYYEAEQRGEALPVTVMLGGPPALILSAIAPLPEGVPELLLASLLQGSRLPLAHRPGDAAHPMVTEAEFALLGSAAPRERRPEGPFGDHYGYYSLRHDYPVFHCTALCHRRDPIYPATIVGKPRQEDYYIGEYLQRLLSPLFPLVMPAVADLWTYGETGFHALAAAVVRERYHREAMGAAFRILGEGQLALTKFLLVTDTPRDLSDFKSLLEHVLARCRPETDLYVFADLAMDTLDYAGPKVNEGSKGVLLGLGAPVRELPREWPGTGTLPPGCRQAQAFCAGCLVVDGPTYSEDPAFAATLAPRLAAAPALARWPLVILCDRPARAVASTQAFLWTVFTRFEPAADIHAAASEIQRNHIVHHGPLVIDARMKPWYPSELVCDPETARRVEERWREYFPAGGVEMGASDL